MTTKQPHLFYEGFQYTHHKATSYGHMFRCTQKRSRLCPATARTNPDREDIKIEYSHTNPPDHHKKQRMQMQANIREEAATSRMAGGGGYFPEIPYPLLEGTFWKKGIFRADTYPPTHPPAKSTLVLYDFCHKNRLTTPHPPSFLPKVPLYLAFSRHTIFNRGYFCLKCHYILDLFNFGC